MARTTTTALLRSYNSRVKSQRDWEDTLLDYEWSLSAKTKEDWQAYQAHYEDRIDLAENDPQTQLSFQKKIDSGFRAFQSNEIQRASIDVIEGRDTEQGKLNKLTELYLQAYSIGNYDLAQQLRLQVDNQIVKIQQEQQKVLDGSGGGYGSGGSSSYDSALKTQVNAAITDFKNGTAPIYGTDGKPIMMNNSDGTQTPLSISYLSDLLKTVGETGLDQQTASMGLTDAQTGLELIKDLVGSQIAELQQYASKVSDPAVRAELENKIKALETTKLDIAGDGDKSYTLSYSDLVNEIYARANGNGSVGFVAGGEEGYKFAKFDAQDISNYATLDAEGNPVMSPLYHTSNMKAEFGYSPNEQMVYELKDGVMKAIPKNQLSALERSELTRGNSVGGTKFNQSEIFAMAGLKDTGSFYELSPGMQKILKDSGFNLDASGLISKDAIKFDQATGMPEFIAPDGTQSVIWKAEGDRIVPTVRQAVTADQYLNERGYQAPNQASANSLGGIRMNAAGLQPAAGAALLQAQKGANFVQGAGVSGMLQQAASASMINSINAKAIEELRVKELERQKQALAVQKLQTPTITGVKNIEQVPVGFAVKPYTPPTLGKVTTAPSSKMTSGGTSLQGGTGYLQGGSSSLLFGSGGLSVNTGGYSGSLSVR